jgi:WS/DGAT/MGAT family acyltransferase
MSGFDARFLSTETATAHMHTIKVVVVDASGRTDPLTPERTVDLVEARLGRMPVLRRRAVPVPGGLGQPVVIDDPDFDLSRHLRHATAAPPGGPRQLDDVIAAITAVPLPRDRPLWELTVVDGLHDGRHAFVMKLHHSLADGVAAVALLENAFVVDEADAIVEPARPEPVPDRAALLRTAAGSLAHAVADAPAIGARTVAGRRRARDTRHSVPVHVPGPFAGPRTPLNVALTADRTFASLTLDMADLAAVKRAVAARDGTGVTVNDAFLALCGGGVRRHLSRLGQLPAASLVAAVPMAIGTDHRRLEGNHLDNLFLPLRTDLADPRDRVRAIHDTAAAARRVRTALGTDLLGRRADLVPPFVQTGLARAWAATRLSDRVRPPLNLVASCVRGPRVPLELDGGVVNALYSSGPILEGIGLNITAWTYVDTMYVSGLGCSASLPDPAELADDVRDELTHWTALI